MHLENSSLKGAVKTFVHQPSSQQKYDLQITLNGIKVYVNNILKHEHKLLRNRTLGIKFQLSANIQLKKYEYQEQNEDPQIRYVDPFFISTAHVYYANDFDDDLETVFQEIKNSFEAFIQQGSGWIMDYVKLIRLKLFRYQLLSGGKNINGLCKELINK